jgi:tRNA threonylcarbamoyladenosine biosynthesis protein TsaB
MRVAQYGAAHRIWIHFTTRDAAGGVRRPAAPPVKQAMWICALETSSQFGEVAVLDPEGCCRVHALSAALSHARDLFPALTALLAAVGRTPGELDLIAVDHGPGSYTGIRVGVTAAKTLAYALGRPVVAVDSLAVLARNVDATDVEFAAPVIDARLGQVYASIYRVGTRAPILGDFVGAVDALVPQLPPGTVVFGDAVERYREKFAAFAHGPAAWSQPRAEIVARLGRETFLASGATAPDALVPHYLRVSDAERKRKEREAHAS